jgi:hypothetical protein
VHIEKEDIADLLRARGEHDKAASVECALPRHVDIKEDAGLLHQFDVNVSEVTAAAGAPEEPGHPTGAGSA